MVAPNPQDHWAALGVEPGANQQALKQAFRRLARRWHPDLNANDPIAEERFKRINEAYAVLTDPRRRQAWETSEPSEEEDRFAAGFPEFDEYLAALFGKKCDGSGILMNIADGGNAPPKICGDIHHMKTEEYRKRVSEKLTGRKGHPAWNKGIPIKEEVRQKIIGEGNGVAQWWKLTFSDSREIVMCGLSNWCKENGYDKSKISALYHKKEGRKKHKDIVTVEKLAQAPTQGGN